MKGKGAVEDRVDGEDAAVGEDLIGCDDGLVVGAPGREGELEIVLRLRRPVVVAWTGVVCEAGAGGGRERVHRWALLHGAFWGVRSVPEVRGIYIRSEEVK